MYGLSAIVLAALIASLFAYAIYSSDWRPITAETLAEQQYALTKDVRHFMHEYDLHRYPDIQADMEMILEDTGNLYNLIEAKQFKKAQDELNDLRRYFEIRKQDYFKKAQP